MCLGVMFAPNSCLDQTNDSLELGVDLELYSWTRCLFRAIFHVLVGAVFLSKWISDPPSKRSGQRKVSNSSNESNSNKMAHQLQKVWMDVKRKGLKDELFSFTIIISTSSSCPQINQRHAPTMYLISTEAFHFNKLPNFDWGPSNIHPSNGLLLSPPFLGSVAWIVYHFPPFPRSFHVSNCMNEGMRKWWGVQG